MCAYLFIMSTAIRACSIFGTEIEGLRKAGMPEE
jgi:hypothetical protein